MNQCSIKRLTSQRFSNNADAHALSDTNRTDRRCIGRHRQVGDGTVHGNSGEPASAQQANQARAGRTYYKQGAIAVCQAGDWLVYMAHTSRRMKDAGRQSFIFLTRESGVAKNLIRQTYPRVPTGTRGRVPYLYREVHYTRTPPV